MRSFIVAGLVIGVLAIGGLTVFFGLQSEAEEPDSLLATANGTEIRQSDLTAALDELPPPYNSLPAEQVAPLVLQQLILDQLLLDAARAAETDQSDRFQALLERERERLLRDVYLEQQINAELTEDRLQAAYDLYVQANPPEREIRARHILVEERETAESLIAELQDGADFAELARENSTGPTGPGGGDLGWFTDGMMVPAFSEAAFGLDVGSFPETPVETQFGWHVITVTDQRETETPSFESVEPQLRDELSRTVAQELLDSLRGDAEVALTDEAPRLPEAPGQPEPTEAP